MLRKKTNKPPVSQVKTGRPPKNMCKPCKGWGALWTVLTKIYYYGDGSEQARKEQQGLVSEECTDCKGTGFKGGRLRSYPPPIMGKQRLFDSSVKNVGTTLHDIADPKLDEMVAEERTYQYEEREEQDKAKAAAALDTTVQEAGMPL